MLKFAVVAVSGAISLMSLVSSLAHAADWPGLPPTEQTIAALSNQPRTLEAQAMLDVAKARSAALNAGSHEWTVRAGLQNRSVKNGTSSREWETALERAIRLPGKADLDGRLGQSQVQQAEFAVGDAMHESGKELLKSWLDYARARESVRVWEAQTALLKKQMDIVEKRIRAGDAPKLEREAARAALSQSQSQTARAVLQRESVLSLLKARYPHIIQAQIAQVQTELPEPAQLEGTLEAWRAAMLDDNHELALSQAAAQSAKLNAERQSANLRPDPALGLRFSSEQGGDEKILGAYVSIALPGAARSAERDAAQAEAQAAQVRANAIKARLSQEAEVEHLGTLHHYDAWLSAKESSVAFQKQAEGTARAYQLGEADLSESLTVRRLALEAQLGEISARADALETFYRLHLDAHRLWDFHQGD